MVIKSYRYGIFLHGYSLKCLLIITQISEITKLFPIDRFFDRSVQVGITDWSSALISRNYLQVRLYVTIQVVLLVGLIIAHVTPAIKEDPLSCTLCRGFRRAKMTQANRKKIRNFMF